MSLKIRLKTMLTANALAGALVATAFLSPSAVLACDAAGKNTHVGNLMSVDARQKTFTIEDAQSHNAITFAANDKIIEGLKNANGSIMVNYEESGDKLTAVGVTF